MSERFVSPRQVAKAIDVSESSLKRWCDRGLIPVVRTAGGHRRMALSAVLEFLRQQDRPIARPELLGLPANTGKGPRVVERTERELLEALVDGDEQRSRQLLFDMHLAGLPVSRIGDQIIAPAMREIGRRWECNDLEVFRERRACGLVLRALLDLESAMPNPAPEAPLAIGASLEGDQYQVSNMIAELVLRQNGWHAITLGASLPVDTLASALSQFRPRLFWLSVSHLDDPEAFLNGYDQLYQRATEQGTAVAVGGRALDESLRQRMRYTSYGDRFEHLEAFARSLHPPATARQPLPDGDNGNR